RNVVNSDVFIADKGLLDNSLVAVKLVTGFDKVNAADLVSMRQSAAFLDDFAAGKLANLKPEDVKRLLARPIAIPQVFLDALTVSANVRRTELAARRVSSGTPDPYKLAALQADERVVESLYEYVMSLQPHQFELRAPIQPVAALPVRSG